MSDILWQTFNDTYTKFHSQLFIQPSFNNYSDKHFWKMIYNILIKILQYIHSNYERYMMNKFHIHFTTFTSQHSLHNIHQNLGMILQQTFNTSCITNFQQTFNTNWVTDISSQHLFQHSFHTSFNNLWNNSSSHIHRNILSNTSSQIEWQIFYNILHHNSFNDWVWIIH